MCHEGIVDVYVKVFNLAPNLFAFDGASKKQRGSPAIPQGEKGGERRICALYIRFLSPFLPAGKTRRGFLPFSRFLPRGISSLLAQFPFGFSPFFLPSRGKIVGEAVGKRVYIRFLPLFSPPRGEKGEKREMGDCECSVAFPRANAASLFSPLEGKKGERGRGRKRL